MRGRGDTGVCVTVPAIPRGGPPIGNGPQVDLGWTASAAEGEGLCLGPGGVVHPCLAPGSTHGGPRSGSRAAGAPGGNARAGRGPRACDRGDPPHRPGVEVGGGDGERRRGRRGRDPVCAVLAWVLRPSRGVGAGSVEESQTFDNVIGGWRAAAERVVGRGLRRARVTSEPAGRDATRGPGRGRRGRAHE